MDFKPIKKKKTYEEIIEQVKKMIAEGVLQPGDRLISERELADKLEVGRSAVREAFRALEAMGVVEVRSGEGTFIREVDVGTIIEKLSMVLVLEHDTIKELLELRKIIEVGAAGLAALRRTQEHLHRMEQVLHQMERGLISGDLGEEADWEFHYTIAQATQNSLLVKLMNTIAGTMRRVLYAARRQLYLTPGTPERLLREHYAIFEAIKAGRVERARGAMFDHLDGVEKGFLQ